MIVIATVSQHRPGDARQLGGECDDHNVGMRAGEHLTHPSPDRVLPLCKMGQGGSRAVDQLRSQVFVAALAYA